MKILLPLLLALLALPLQAEEQPPVYDSDDLQLEGRLSAVKDKAEAGDAAAARDLALSYARNGHNEQYRAWGKRYLEMMEQKATEGDVAAMFSLGSSYRHGVPPAPQDTAQAVTWLSRASDAGEPAAAYSLAEIYEGQGDTELSRSFYTKAYERYNTLAAEEPENSMHLYRLGYMQLNGLGTPAGAADGIARLEKAADMGNPWACSQLFKTYAQGIGTEKNMTRAISYARKLADEKQDGLMAYATALAYLQGDGVAQDEATGQHYLDMAARANIVDAICLKARRLKEAGKAEEALACYTQAASMQQEEALIEAARMLLHGEGVEKDEARALAYLQTASTRLNSPRAAYEFARYYESIGEDDMAEDWYVVASDAGGIEAMAKRGLMHLNPFSSVSWSPTAAYQWWKKGSDAGDADCILYRRLFLYGLIPLVLVLVFGLPIYTVNRLNRKALQEEGKPLKVKAKR